MGFWLVAALQERWRRRARQCPGAIGRSTLNEGWGWEEVRGDGKPVKVDERLAIVHRLLEDGELVAERPAESVGRGHAWS